MIVYSSEPKNRIHKPNGPAFVQEEKWAWCLHGNIHRYYGPADSHGGWYIRGHSIKFDY